MIINTATRNKVATVLCALGLIATGTCSAEDRYHSGSHAGPGYHEPMHNGPMHNRSMHNGPVHGGPGYNGPIHGHQGPGYRGPVHPRGGYYHGNNGVYIGPIIVGVPFGSYYGGCETVKVCDEFDDCWIEEYCD